MKKVKVGVVGVGHLGRFHAQKYALIKEADLVGVTDIDAGRASTVAAETNTKFFPSYKDLIGKVDAVSIVTPTESHYSVGMDFLSKGVDVLVEKPIAMNPAEAEGLICEAVRAKAILQVGHLERFNPAVTALLGRVKNPMFIECNRLSPFPGRSTDIDVIFDLMIHDIDIILNMVSSDVDTIEAVGIPVLTGKADIANARIKFRNGCVADVTSSRVSKERLRKIRLFQHDAYISIDYANQRISISRVDKAGVEAPFPKIVEEEIEIEKKDTLLEELKSFVECSLKRKAPLVSGADGKRALEVAEMIQESIKKSMAHFSGG